MNAGYRTALVTGAGSGIGLETAKALSQQQFQVIVICRDLDRAEQCADLVRSESNNERVFAYGCDLADQQQIRRTADTILAAFPSLDILVNNAGCNYSERVCNPQGIEMQLAINFLAPFLLTRLLLPALLHAPQGRILNITSRAHGRGSIHWDNLNLERNYTSMAAYNQSKLALVCFTYELARRLEGTTVTVNCMQPGLVNTSIGNKHAIPGHALFWNLLKQLGKTPDKAAASIVRLLTDPLYEQSNGTYFSGTTISRSSKASYDRDTAGRLWTIAQHLTHSEDLQP